jgi:hypothetical protein
MMRGVPLPGVRAAGLRALAGAGLWAVTGCGVLVDEPQLDTRAEQRPGTWVRRLETEVASLRGAYDDMIVKASPAQRRRLPSIGSELSRLADAAASMRNDLDRKRGRFGEHLAAAESVATSIDQQLTGSPVTSTVRSRWWDTTYALGYVREFYRAVGPERLYEVESDPRGVVRLRTNAPADGYDASFEVGQVPRSYDRMMKTWRDAPVRRAGATWTGQLDRERQSLGDPVGALGRVNAGERGAVASAAERVRQQVERVRPLVEAREAELPHPFLEAWSGCPAGSGPSTSPERRRAALDSTSIRRTRYGRRRA